MKTIPHHIRPMLTIVLLALWCLYTPSASAQHLLGSHSNAKELEALQKLKLFVNDIERFHHSFPLERAYLHFDNTAYFRGEDIWLKAYVMRTDSNQLTNLSRVLYVELVAPSGDVLQTHKLHSLHLLLSTDSEQMAQTKAIGISHQKVNYHFIRAIMLTSMQRFKQ